MGAAAAAAARSCPPLPPSMELRRPVSSRPSPLTSKRVPIPNFSNIPNWQNSCPVNTFDSTSITTKITTTTNKKIIVIIKNNDLQKKKKIIQSNRFLIWNCFTSYWYLRYVTYLCLCLCLFLSISTFLLICVSRACFLTNRSLTVKINWIELQWKTSVLVNCFRLELPPSLPPHSSFFVEIFNFIDLWNKKNLTFEIATEMSTVRFDSFQLNSGQKFDV